MLQRCFRLQKHAWKMVGRTIRSYALLSVTVVLSMTLLLGYMMYTDSSLYNRYKAIFRQDRNIVTVRDIHFENTKLKYFQRQAEELGNTSSYIYTTVYNQLNQVYRTEDGLEFQIYNAAIQQVPLHFWTFYRWHEPCEIIMLDGSGTDGMYCLNPGEVILEESLYRVLGLDKEEEPYFQMDLKDGDVTLNLKVVGTIHSTDIQPEFIAPGESLNSMEEVYTPFILIPQGCISMEEVDTGWERTIALYTDAPEQVTSLAERVKLEGGIVSICRQQDAALSVIRTQKQTKAFIAMALLLLLGINLYSSFTNALNDRKFEIGVKRAVGASKWAIVRQFLYESVLVMAANILISISLVADGFLVYKYIYERIPDRYGVYYDWIITISPQSVAMFALCSVTLTVVFSLIFAYKSTQVEIVQYLKAE